MVCIVKSLCSQSYGFSSSQVQMWELDHKESWVSVKELMLSNCDAGEESWETPGLQGYQKKINHKGNQSWIFLRMTVVGAEAPILWLPDVKNWLVGKDTDDGRNWRLKEKGTTENEMDGWRYWLSGHEFKQTPGDSGRQRSLVCCGPWGHEELDTT